MRRGVSIEGSILAFILCVVLSACGGTGGNSGSGSNSGGSSSPPSSPAPPAPSVAMQQGQWEFNVNNGLYFVEANVTDSANGFASTVYNTQLFDPSQVVAAAPPGVGCGNVEMSGTISAYSLTGVLASDNNPIMNFSGSVSSAGQSVSSGTSSAPNDICSIFNSGVSAGTFSGYTVPSFSGTYEGQITTWPSGTSPLALTLTLTQNPDFSISGSGQITGQGIIRTVALPTSPTGSNVYSGVIGASFTLAGTLTEGATLAIQITGHANPNATQITVNVLSGSAPLNLNVPSSYTWQTGTLTRQ